VNRLNVRPGSANPTERNRLYRTDGRLRDLSRRRLCKEARFVAQKITVKRTWLQGRVGEPKTDASAAPVPMHPLLGEAMLRWRVETPYAGESDWVFASFKLHGRQPGEGNMIGADYLRPAAVRAGVLAVGDKRRFGWHNFRHSLASFLVASGTDTKTVQELMRHSKVQTTLDLYSQSMPTERMVAQGSMLNAIFSQSLPLEKLITGESRV
jgi:integrase